MLPQEQGIQMTGEKEKEDPYRKCTERESGLQRGLKKREKVGEPLQREKKWKRENKKYWSQRCSQQVQVSRARSLCRSRFHTLIVFRAAFTLPCIFFLKSKPSLSTLTRLHSAFCFTSILLRKLSSLHSSPSLQMPSLFLT